MWPKAGGLCLAQLDAPFLYPLSLPSPPAPAPPPHPPLTPSPHTAPQNPLSWVSLLETCRCASTIFTYCHLTPSFSHVRVYQPFSHHLITYRFLSCRYASTLFTPISHPSVTSVDVRHIPLSHAPISHPSVTSVDVRHIPLSHAPISHPSVTSVDVRHIPLSHAPISHPSVTSVDVRLIPLSHALISHPSVMSIFVLYSFHTLGHVAVRLPPSHSTI